MDVPKEITDILSQLGLPAGAIALAVGLVRGARALEEDASEIALKYVSGLLTRGSISGLAELGVTLVPRIFDRIFGSNPFSYKFISRSIIATTLFWLLLLALKNPDWHTVWANLFDYEFLLFIIWYPLDWLSLIKARFLMQQMLRKTRIISLLGFLCLDLLISYLLIALATTVGSVIDEYAEETAMDVPWLKPPAFFYRITPNN